MSRSVLFVCLGNICRSPLADGIASRIVREKGLDVRIDSAGTGSWHIGESPCDNSIRVAAMNGVDISQLKGRQVKKEDFDAFDHIIALDDKNVADLKALGCQKVMKLGSFGLGNQDVPDPYFFNGFEGFDKVYGMIEEGVNNLFKELALFSESK